MKIPYTLGDIRLLKRTALTLTGSALIYGSVFAYTTFEGLKITEGELEITEQSSQDHIALLTTQIQRLTEENQSMKDVLTEEQQRNVNLEREKRRNEREIDTLQKLTTIDPELLKKYSKVFFLSENYSPPELEDVPLEYKIRADKNIQILEDIEPFLVDMLEDATDDGINLRVISAFRSFEEQMSLKSAYVTQYGSGANQFSADQGYSEHQLGTTLDFGTPEVTGAYMSFESTTAFEWLQNNAHKYGFILSYPKGNSYYQYEPWHWRFVGRSLAKDLKKDSRVFYELDQREIDSYLVELFD